MADKDIPVSPAQEQLYAALKGQAKPEVMQALLKHMTEQISLQNELIDSIKNQTRKIEDGNIIIKKGDPNLKGFLREQEGLIGKFFRFTEARAKGETSIKDLFTKENILTTALRGLSLGATRFGMPGIAVFAGINKVLNDYTSYVKDKQAKKEDKQIELINAMSWKQGKSQDEIIAMLKEAGTSDQDVQKLWQKHLDIQEKGFRDTLLEAQKNGDTQEELEATLERDFGMFFKSAEMMEYLAPTTVARRKGGKKGGKTEEQKKYDREAAELTKQNFTPELIEKALGPRPLEVAVVEDRTGEETTHMVEQKAKFIEEGGSADFFDKMIKQLRDSHNVLKTISTYNKDLLATQRHAVGLMDEQFREKMAHDEEMAEDAEKRREGEENISKEEKKTGGFLSTIFDMFKKGFMGSPLGKFIMGGMSSLTGVVTKLVGGLGGTIGSILGPAMAVIAVAGIGTMVGSWISKNIIGEETTGGERGKGIMSKEQMEMAKKRGYTGPMNEEAFNAWLRAGGAKMAGAGGAGVEIPAAVNKVYEAQITKEKKQQEAWQNISEAQKAGPGPGAISINDQTRGIHKIKSNSDDAPLAYLAKVGAK